ncbi:unnamed protein product [Orchesella dallaii]|uniref:Uncharacterized protein n=1 Tax=Orchesella dallaii TaxID=48710 RepID=A0ABP1R2T7_9HEXA
MSHQFLYDFRVIFTYYILGTASPINYSHLSTTIYSPVNSNNYASSRIKKWLFYLIQLLLLINFIQVIRLLILTLWELHVNGSVEMFGLFGLMMWLGAFIPVFCYNFILLKPNCLKALFRSMDTCDKVMNNAKEHFGMDTISKILSQKSFLVWFLVIHSALLDYFAITNCMWSTYQNIEEDPTLLYSAIPWKDPWVDMIYWFIPQIIMGSIVMLWSVLLTLPGVVTYYFECVIKTLAKSVEIGPTTKYPLEAILRDYQLIEIAVRDLHQNGFSKMLLIFFGTFGIQQTIESFCVFQMIKQGASWDEYQFYFWDLMFSTGRVFHVMDALSRAYRASQIFLNSVRIEVGRQSKIQRGNRRCLRSRREPLLKKIRTAKPILMRIGHLHCTVSPINYSHFSATIYSPVNSNKYVPSRTKQWLFYFIRFLLLINFIQVARLLILDLWELHVNGSVDMFGLFGLMMWGGAFMPVFCYDFILLKPNCLKALFRSMDTCDKVMDKAKEHLGKETISKILSKKSFLVWLLTIHSVAFDYFSITICMWTTYQNIEEDPTLLYSAIPWKAPWVNVIYWFIPQIIMGSFVMIWSVMFTLPGVVAYHYECVIRALAKSVEIGPTTKYSLEAILRDYQLIEFTVRDLHQNGFSKMLLLFFAAFGVQQTIESFCVFQMIKQGASWDEYQFFFADLMFATVRVFHGIDALSRAYRASQVFLNSVRIEVGRLSKIQRGNRRCLRSRREPLLKKIRTAKPIFMRIGHLPCKQNLILTGGSVHMDNIVSSALWP